MSREISAFLMPDAKPSTPSSQLVRDFATTSVWNGGDRWSVPGGERRNRHSKPFAFPKRRHGVVLRLNQNHRWGRLVGRTWKTLKIEAKTMGIGQLGQAASVNDIPKL